MTSFEKTFIKNSFEITDGEFSLEGNKLYSLADFSFEGNINKTGHIPQEKIFNGVIPKKHE